MLLLAGLLAACGSSESEEPPAPASADEARALEDATEMLDEQRHAPEPAAGEAASPGASSSGG